MKNRMRIIWILYSCVLLLAFIGFVYMNYCMASDNDTTATFTGSPVLANLSVTTTETIEVIELFNAMLNDNDRATTRVFALVTVLIAAATVIVVLQFFTNHQILKELEESNKKFEEHWNDEVKKLKESNKKFGEHWDDEVKKIEESNKKFGEHWDDEFNKKESKLSRIENAIQKVESLAQATSYPLRISMENIKPERFYPIEEYGKFIKNSFYGFNKNPREDKADWNRILFFARQALPSLQEPGDKLNTEHLIAVAACKSEECTGDREEKSILLSLAIDTFECMGKKALDDTVNLASAYARRGMLYANLPDSGDYKQADQLFERITREERFENQSGIAINCFFNWGISWLARASIFIQDLKKFGDYYFNNAKNNAEQYLEKANNIDPHIADYALLSLYSISKDKNKCEAVISGLEDRLKKSSFESLPLPKLHRIYEDIDLVFIIEDKDLYDRLVKLAKDNEDRR